MVHGRTKDKCYFSPQEVWWKSIPVNVHGILVIFTEVEGATTTAESVDQSGALSGCTEVQYLYADGEYMTEMSSTGYPRTYSRYVVYRAQRILKSSTGLGDSAITKSLSPETEAAATSVCWMLLRRVTGLV